LRMMFSTSSPTYPASVRVVASAITASAGIRLCTPYAKRGSNQSRIVLRDLIQRLARAKYRPGDTVVTLDVGDARGPAGRRPAPIAAARGGASATHFVAHRDFAATRFTQNLLLARFSQYCA
jgi:hypothetical protein